MFPQIPCGLGRSHDWACVVAINVGRGRELYVISQRRFPFRIPLCDSCEKFAKLVWTYLKWEPLVLFQMGSEGCIALEAAFFTLAGERR